jgi:hypothetical protein
MVTTEMKLTERHYGVVNYRIIMWLYMLITSQSTVAGVSRFGPRSKLALVPVIRHPCVSVGLLTSELFVRFWGNTL